MLATEGQACADMQGRDGAGVVISEDNGGVEGWLRA
jgi:hypothetical protein